MRPLDRGVLLAAAICAAVAAKGETLDLWSGWARVDITPDMSAGKKPVLSGLMIPRFPDKVDEPVMATALVLEGRRGSERVEQAVLVSCDVAVGTHNQWAGNSLLDDLRERLKGRVSGLDLGRLFLMSTHTHNGPSFMDGQYDLPKESWVLRPAEYRAFLLERLVEVVERAWQQRRPSGMTWAIGQAVLGYNRRVVYENGEAVMGGWRRDPKFDYIEGREDHALKALFFWTPDGQLEGVLINVACPAQVQIQELVISSDFWGAVRKGLSDKPGFEKAFVLPMLASAGDQWPYQQLREKAEASMRTRRGVDLTREIARRVVRELEDLLPVSRSDVLRRLEFQHRVETRPVPLRVITADEAKRIDKEYRKNVATPSPTQHQWVRRLQLLKDRYERQQHERLTAQVELHFLRLGDVAVATNPFELFVDYGMQIEARSPALLTLTSQLAAETGVGLGYLPTVRALPHQGYSADIVYNNCLVGPEGGKMVVDETVKQLNQLWGKP